jgi:hypothetical protein
MWIVELNVLGRRFTREVPRPAAPVLAPRRVQTRITQLLRPRDAA